MAAASEEQDQEGLLAKEPEFNLRVLGGVFCGVFIFWGALVAFFAEGVAADYLKSRFDQWFYFNAEALISGSGEQPANLKILVQDDRTIDYRQGQLLDIVDWSVLLQNIAAQKPQVILIDKMFAGNPFGPHHNATYTQKIQDALATIAAIETPIYVGANIHRESIGKAPLDLSPAVYDIKAYATPPAANPKTSWQQQFPFLDHRFAKGEARGPHSRFSGVFQGTGHITYANKGIAAISPLVLLPQGRIMPHLGLRAAERLAITGAGITANGVPIPLDNLGQTAINHRPREFFHVWSLAAPLYRAQTGKAETLVAPGDIVFIIPGYFTGTADFHEGGPFGEMPGGLIIGAILSSLITGDWLAIFQHDVWLLVLMVMVGGFLGLKSRPMYFWLWLLGGAVVYGGLVLFLFIAWSWQWPLGLPLLALVGGAVIVFAYNILHSELQRIRLKRDYYLEKALRLQEEGERKVLTERLALGKAVQDLLLPKNLGGRLANFDYQMRYKPALQMSGDWLYYWDLGHERRIFIGDVVGKGPSAALGVAVIITTIKEAESRQLSVEDCAALVNDRLLDHFGGEVTTTFAGVSLFEDSRLIFYNAGSPGWFLVHEHSGASYIYLRSNPLGMDPKCQLAAKELTFDGSVLFFTFTDGYLEGARAYKRLTRAVSAIAFADLSHDDIHRCLLATGEGHRLEDDMTMVSIRGLAV